MKQRETSRAVAAMIWCAASAAHGLVTSVAGFTAALVGFPTVLDPVTVSEEARRDRIPIDTVALGTPNGVLVNPGPFAAPVPVPPDPQLMQQIARVSGGRAFNARSADELSSIYTHLGNQLGTVKRRREITAVFALAGLVVLVGAAGASAQWWGRLP